MKDAGERCAAQEAARGKRGGLVDFVDEGGEVLEVFAAEEGAGLEGGDDAADEEKEEADTDFFFH